MRSTASNSVFKIVLDRQSGVYTAGEVITGTVTVDASQHQKKCRSLLVSMTGKGKVHWHYGTGDNRRDYYGEKIYLTQERTLLGNFYRTACLDEAGSEAEYGGAVGDGTIYIPCLPNEGSNGRPMRLIVRICDYDWGKKDDNVGEFIMDAKELALKEDAVTFNLTRNGKPEKGTATIAAYFIPTSTVTPSSNGRDIIQSSQTLVLKVLSLKELRSADWFGKNDLYVQVWRAPDDLPSPTPAGKKLPEPNKKLKLPTEKTSFKFAFPTRADSPGSAVFSAGDRAYIAYYIRAEIDKRGWKDPSIKLPITIIPLRPVPKHELLLHVTLDSSPTPIHGTRVCCFKCGEKGTITIKIKLRRTAYAPGEKIDLSECTIVNDSTLPVTANVSLKQEIVLQTTSRLYHHTYDKDKTFLLAQKPVDPQEECQLGGVEVDMPTVPPSFYGGKGLSSAWRDPLLFDYKLRISAKAVSGGDKVNVDHPILVSALPPTRDAIERASSTLGQRVNIENFIVKDDSPCDTVPMYTGLEDGTVEVKPSINGSANIWDKQEDSGGSGNAYNYEPEVAIWGPESKLSIPEPIKEEVNGEVDHKTAYNELLTSMETEYDSRLTVDKWTKEYPSAASNLTPEEFGGVLKKVLLSMEQAAVARELTSGMGASLTTQHIISSMEACPFSKVDLIGAMAPYVSDPENKELVLSSLYSYERKDASKFFVS